MENTNHKTVIPTERREIPTWNHSNIYFAIAWWNSPQSGIGHFNRALYDRLVEIKNQINLG